MPAATITCPECHKTFKGRLELDGKRVRCPQCQNPFVVRMGQTLKVDQGGGEEAIQPARSRPALPPQPAAPEAPGLAAAPPAPAPTFDEDEEEGENPYGVTTIDLRPRCPNCANPLENDEAVVCLHCGYNTQTRAAVTVKKTIETTTTDRFTWLLPGLLSAGGITLLVLGCLFYCVALPSIMPGKFFVHESLRMWLVIIGLAIMWPLGKIAMNRLIFNPTPPELEKD